MRKNGTVLMPSSLLLMSGPLPTEVFKTLPVVHGGGGGEGGRMEKLMDNCYYKCAAVAPENNILPVGARLREIPATLAEAEEDDARRRILLEWRGLVGLETSLNFVFFFREWNRKLKVGACGACSRSTAPPVYLTFSSPSLPAFGIYMFN